MRYLPLLVLTAVACGATEPGTSPSMVAKAYNDSVAVADVPTGADYADAGPANQDAGGACTFNIQCSKDELCLAGLCATKVPCLSDKQCAAFGLVCSATAGHCVACVTAADCAADQACKANQCLATPTPCASSKQCAAGLVCDPSLKLCVECALTTDCDQGFTCIDTVCALQVCQAGAASCISPAVRKACKGDGSGYLEITCASDAVCENGSCEPLVCEPASASCVQGKRSLCNANGTAIMETPCAADQVCVAGACVATTCNDGEVSCEGGQLLICKADGTGWTSKSCGSGQVCSGKACVAQVCVAGKTYCDSTKIMQCNTDGTATQLVGDCATAAKPSTCVAGACAPLACTPGTSQCADGGTLNTCKPDGSSYTQSACGVGAACEAGACKAKVCVAGSLACVGADLQMCKTDGSGWDVKTCDDTNLCTADSCDAKLGCVNVAVNSVTVSGCYTGGAATKGKGACKAGFQACKAGKLEDKCQNEVVPSVNESCDGVDDDCDGQTDEGCGAPPAGMVLIPAGTFWMGCNSLKDKECVGKAEEKPQHKVTLSAYYMDVTEVTVAEYKKCVDSGQCGMPGEDKTSNMSNWDNTAKKAKAGREQHPVNSVTWTESQKYCKWRGGQVDALNASKYDLPTEAQWEMAARGDCQKNGSTADDDVGCKTAMRTNPWGEQSATCEYANMYLQGLGAGCGNNSTMVVGSKLAGASPYGLYDMAGNVREWTLDWFSTGYYGISPVSDPLNVQGATYRVSRGGIFEEPAAAMRASGRTFFQKPFLEDYGTGFRCARAHP